MPPVKQNMPDKKRDGKTYRGKSATGAAQRRRKVAPRKTKAMRIESRPQKQKSTLPAVGGDTVRIIPLGGVEEVGRNMTVVETKDDILVVDAGFHLWSHQTSFTSYLRI